MSDVRAHWDNVYCSKEETEVSWFQETPKRSLELIRGVALDVTTPIIDVGGGASRLVDGLFALGYVDMAVLDVSEKSLERSKVRLGSQASRVDWIVADITAWQPHRRWHVWHDRAVFHFLVDSRRQDAYVAALEQATGTDATVIIATFALDGPERCSGLPVQRYSPETLVARLGAKFQLVDQKSERHVTPKGAQQSFQYATLRRL